MTSKMPVCAYNKYVDCPPNGRHCEKCGWNPQEYKRRTGHDQAKGKTMSDLMLMLYDEGMNDREIADALEVDRGTVFRWRTRNGLLARGRKYGEENDEHP